MTHYKQLYELAVSTSAEELLAPEGTWTPYISSADGLEIHLNYYSRANEAVLREINIPQMRVKSLEARKSIFHRQA